MGIRGEGGGGGGVLQTCNNTQDWQQRRMKILTAVPGVEEKSSSESFANNCHILPNSNLQQHVVPTQSQTFNNDTAVNTPHSHANLCI